MENNTLRLPLFWRGLSPQVAFWQFYQLLQPCHVLSEQQAEQYSRLILTWMQDASPSVTWNGCSAPPQVNSGDGYGNRTL